MIILVAQRCSFYIQLNTVQKYKKKPTKHTQNISLYSKQYCTTSVLRNCHDMKLYKLHNNDLKYSEGYVQVIDKHFPILQKGLKHLIIVLFQALLGTFPQNM